ncbi:MAG: hypothetical protein ACI8QW_000729, partial [Saprospiraceae bacterium]
LGEKDEIVILDSANREVVPVFLLKI